MMPTKIPNWIYNREQPAIKGEWFDKINPANGRLLTRAARSRAEDVQEAVIAAKRVFPEWSATPAVQRGMILHKIVVGMQNYREDISRIVAEETGKSYKDAMGETNGAIQCGLFFASEGQRLYGRTTTSGIANKYAMTIRQPIGVAGLIIAANTPIANVAWKVFPALICGNTAVLKVAEDTPATGWKFGEIAMEAGLPAGVLNIVQGYGDEAGQPLVEHPDVGVISFTGSTEVGRIIQTVAAPRFARLSLELGGKNALVVCDDADLENAAKWVLLSAFSNAGQRCASTSRVIIFDSIYDDFRQLLIKRVESLKIGTKDEDDFGPVINLDQLNNIIASIKLAGDNGATILTGGERMSAPEYKEGFYIEPTIMENVEPQADISRNELFGPVAILYRVRDFESALSLANDSPYGLTAAIHTNSIHRAMRFCERVESGVAVVNAGTYGSEPHMPFGGRKLSGNGSREPGTEALDIYSELKDLYININTGMV